MKLYVWCDYDATYHLSPHETINNYSNYGSIELTEEEYFEFEKCEIKYLEWRFKIVKLLEKEDNDRANARST